MKARGDASSSKSEAWDSGEFGGEDELDGDRSRLVAVRRCRGAFVHVLQRRRCLARRVGVGGGFTVQFYPS